MSRPDPYPRDTSRLLVPHHRGRHRRQKSPGLRWHKSYTAEDLRCGRVLVIDYVKKDLTKEGMQKVVAEEISSLESLKRVYSNPDRRSEAVLRVFHVQNADWAVPFLLSRFKIDDDDSPKGTDFATWVTCKNERRSSRPVMNAKTWRTRHDPWRGVSTTSFGLDYLKQYRASDEPGEEMGDSRMKSMELNHYDENDSPVYGWDVYVQRLGVYIQHKDVIPASPPELESPYHELDGFHKSGYMPNHNHVKLDSLDNGNVIIIFENSQSNSIEDTMIPARTDWEKRWRRLPFHLAVEYRDVSNDEDMALECMKMILQDMFRALAQSWETMLDICYSHVSILEDKIYEQPADESRAPELFTNSNMFLKVEKLMLLHVEVVTGMRNHLVELNDDEDVDNNWLDASPADFERLSNLVQEDLVKPTANLADLMYKSVGIRDSRHSLHLGESMWRLSWITFIFLPLTFIVGFFGMQVDLFDRRPSIKWYFVTAVPFMLTVIIVLFAFKNYRARRQQTPYQRGVYEHLFQDLSNTYPRLWSRGGPRTKVVPRGIMNRLKWRLISYWADPDKTINRGTPDDEDDIDDILGSVSRLKRYWMRQWTGQIDSRRRRHSFRGDEASTEELMESGQAGLGIDTDGGGGGGDGSRRKKRRKRDRFPMYRLNRPLVAPAEMPVADAGTETDPFSWPPGAAPPGTGEHAAAGIATIGRLAGQAPPDVVLPSGERISPPSPTIITTILTTGLARPPLTPAPAHAGSLLHIPSRTSSTPRPDDVFSSSSPSPPPSRARRPLSPAQSPKLHQLQQQEGGGGGGGGGSPGARPSSRGSAGTRNSGVLVEEQETGWLRDSFDRERDRRRSRRSRLQTNVLPPGGPGTGTGTDTGAGVEPGPGVASPSRSRSASRPASAPAPRPGPAPFVRALVVAAAVAVPDLGRPDRGRVGAHEPEPEPAPEPDAEAEAEPEPEAALDAAAPEIEADGNDGNAGGGTSDDGAA
ncbi:MAG: hypothetical protein M1826_006442 [Phylliscum demangeonii]|nr:MAG: hypothetical protein M1826_006442 [Phylliscum demangeonii]